MYYETRGEGIPIVFIHPPLLTGINFMYQLEHLSKKYKIITFDIRGHGQSGYSSRVIDYSLIVEDITLLLNELKIKKAFLCGYSTGGSIVLEFLQMHSERAFGGIVISGMSEVNDYYLKLRILIAVGLSTKKTCHRSATIPSGGMYRRWGKLLCPTALPRILQYLLQSGALPVICAG